MKVRIIVLIIVIMGILVLSLFSFGLKEKVLRGMVSGISEYNCGEDDLCTSCIIDGYTCSCGEHVCSCGNKTVDKTECVLNA